LRKDVNGGNALSCGRSKYVRTERRSHGPVASEKESWKRRTEKKKEKSILDNKLRADKRIRGGGGANALSIWGKKGLGMAIKKCNLRGSGDGGRQQSGAGKRAVE